MHNPKDHITLSQNVGNIEMTGVGAAVDDPVHIQVQVIKLRQQGLICDDLVDLGVALAEPAVEL